MSENKPFFLTTAIDYVNNLPHIGTAYEKICADVIARFKRLEGSPVFFLMGNDEHSINVKKEAQAKGLAPQSYCDEMASRFREIWEKLDISYDAFIRTTDEKHMSAVVSLFRKIHEKGDIYPSKYKGLYCDSCETFYMEKDLEEGRCPQHGTTPQWIEEDNSDMVNGWRRQRHDNWLRLLSTRIGNGVRNWLTWEQVHDAASGLKVFRKECLENIKLFSGMHRFLPTLMKIEGWRVMEVPVNHRTRRAGHAKYGVVNRMFRGLRDTFAVRWMQKRALRYAIDQGDDSDV